MKYLIPAALIVSLAGCSSQMYRDTAQGTFKGDLDVRWVKNNYFLFTPSKENPLVFKRANGEVIAPGPMYTDGGSIPQFLWGVEGYSPWGYAPPYIIHDWLFEAQHCGYQPDNKYSFDDSAKILAEGMKAIMESDIKVRNYFVFDSVYLAVKSPIAKKLWTEGECKAVMSTMGVEAEQGELIMKIQFK